MYVRSSTWVENGPARPPCGARAVPVPTVAFRGPRKNSVRIVRHRRGFGDTSTSSAGFFTANPGAANGIEPGAACYDSSHDPGYVHGVSAVEYALQTPFGYNVTTQLSDAEVACLAGSVAASSAGGATPGGSTTAAPSAIPNNCPWYCSLPGVSSVLTSGCDPATCNPNAAPSTSSNMLVIGGFVVGGILLLSLLKGGR
jgi:hypothetical protein